MKGFFIEITNNLLDPKHRKKMGTAVWEFMWCLDKITKIDDEQIGWVYGGRPIKLKEISHDIGISEPKVSKNLNKLQREGYLTLLRTPYGLVVKLWKAKKRFNQKVGRFNLKVKSNIRQDNDKTHIYNNKFLKIVDNSVKQDRPYAVKEIINKRYASNNPS